MRISDKLETDSGIQYYDLHAQHVWNSMFKLTRAFDVSIHVSNVMIHEVYFLFRPKRAQVLTV